MRAKEFITERQVKKYKSKNLSINKAVKLLNQNCRQSLAMIDNPLWRGMGNHSAEILTIDPSTGERHSQNTSNYYTQLMSYSPYFEGWPKRNKSLICSSSEEYAGGYAGNNGLYAIYPFDNVPIAVCPEADMWFTPLRVPALDIECDEDFDMSQFNNILRFNLRLPDDYKQMLTYVKTPVFAERLANYRQHLIPKAQRILLTPETFIAYLHKCMSPKACGFKLLSIAQYAKNPPRYNECWVGGPVVAIQEDLYYDFLDAVVQSRDSDRAKAAKGPAPRKAALPSGPIPSSSNSEEDEDVPF